MPFLTVQERDEHYYFIKTLIFVDYKFYQMIEHDSLTVLVVDPGKRVCADPVNRDAILGKGGTGPGGGDKEHQSSLDREGDKT